jgi:hypothetical protein
MKEIAIIHNILRNNKYNNTAHQKPQKQKENTDIQLKKMGNFYISRKTNTTF